VYLVITSCLFLNIKIEMKILVTGAAGFIGYWVVRRLLQSDVEVVGIDNINDYYDVNLKLDRLKLLGIDVVDLGNRGLVESGFSNFKFAKVALEDERRLMEVFEYACFDIVINLAAQAGVRYSIDNPHEYISSNITGFLNILECSRKYMIKHLIYASSSSVYGLNSSMPFSSHHSVNHPVSMYAATKKSNELMAHVYSKLYDLPTTGLRFFTVYGAWGRPDMSPMLFADAILNNRVLKIYNYGEMKRDFTYVEDVVESIFLLIRKQYVRNHEWDSFNPDPGSSIYPYRIFNVGSSAPVNILDYVETLEKLLGKVAKKEFLPMQLGDVKDTYCDSSDLESYINYKPKTGLYEGLELFTNWYLNYFKGN
jgi:UDP-glucuronate 4-epimerase